MKIVCIGWGSLIWDSRELIIESGWESDGPYLPIEFARQSSDGRLTLVICDTNKQSRVFWSKMNSENLDECIESLSEREKTTINNIHCVSINDSIELTDSLKKTIQDWLILKSFDYAIWIGLPSKFKGSDKKPSSSEVIKYLADLDRPFYDLAKEYFEKTPSQIETEYRDKIRLKLKWK